MTGMLEKMARAIEAEIGKQDMVLTDPASLRQMMAKRAARAALQAIREPGDRIARAGGAQTFPDPSDDGAAVASAAFTAMIDAILNEG